MNYSCRQIVERLAGATKSDDETRSQITKAAEVRRRKYWDDNREKWNEFTAMNEAALAQGFNGAGNSPVLKLGGMARSFTVPPARMYNDPHLSDTVMNRAATARRKFGIYQPGPPSRMPQRRPSLKIADPANYFGDDPSKMDNYLKGSPDKGMWWLQGAVDEGYRASTPYERQMRTRRSAVRTPLGKPTYY